MGDAMAGFSGFGRQDDEPRKVTSIESRGGGLALVRRLAKQRGVHLLRLTDGQGNQLVAACTKRFKVICQLKNGNLS